MAKRRRRERPSTYYGGQSYARESNARWLFVVALIVVAAALYFVFG